MKTRNATYTSTTTITNHKTTTQGKNRNQYGE